MSLGALLVSKVGFSIRQLHVTNGETFIEHILRTFPIKTCRKESWRRFLEANSSGSQHVHPVVHTGIRSAGSMWKEARKWLKVCNSLLRRGEWLKWDVWVIERSRGHARITVRRLQMFDRQWNSKSALIPYRVLMSNFISTDAPLPPTPLFHTAKCTSALKHNIQTTREAGSSSPHNTALENAASPPDASVHQKTPKCLPEELIPSCPREEWRDKLKQRYRIC